MSCNLGIVFRGGKNDPPPPSFAFATNSYLDELIHISGKQEAFPSSILLSRFMKCDTARHWEHHYRF